MKDEEVAEEIPDDNYEEQYEEEDEEPEQNNFVLEHWNADLSVGSTVLQADVTA